MNTHSPCNDIQWGPLKERYTQDRPRRMLSLDGGGIRGLITLGVLERIESLLLERLNAGDKFRLCDYFDYIAGTSTGALIAAGLATGRSVAEIRRFYKELAPQIFKKQPWYMRWKSKYDATRLELFLQENFKQATNIRPENLRCLLLVVTRNATSGSAWPISSFPGARYNSKSRQDESNLDIPLWKLAKASSSAPTYFAPTIVEIDKERNRRFVFVDGSTTCHTNPAFLLYRMATFEPYRLCWPTGEDRLLVVSVGTGTVPAPSQTVKRPMLSMIGNIKATLTSLITESTIEQDINCRMVGRCVFGNRIDRELGDLIPRDDQGREIPLEIDLGRQFLYARYDVELSRQGLEGIGVTDINPHDITPLDRVESINELERVGNLLGSQVEVEHFGGF